MNFLHLNFLSSPLEGFKTFVYYYETTHQLETLNWFFWSENLDFANFLEYNWINNSIFFIFIYLFILYFSNLSIFGFNLNWFIKIFSLALVFLFFEYSLDIITLFFGLNEENFILSILEYNKENESYSISFLPFEEYFGFFSWVMGPGWGILLFSLFFSTGSYTSLSLIPRKGFEVLSEFFYKASLNLFLDSLGIRTNPDVRLYQEFFLKVYAILFFVLGSNLVGMIPYSYTLTSSLTNTLFISIAVFFNIILNLVKKEGWNYFFNLFMPSGCPLLLAVLLIPLELVSYSFRLISLSIRLFANMMAGHTLMKVIAGFSWSMVLLGDFMILAHYIPFLVLFLLVFLELGVAFIQAYIFVVLICLYLRDMFAAH